MAATVKAESEVFGTVYTDIERMQELRETLASGYRNKDRQAVANAAMNIREYVNEGLDDSDDDNWESVVDYTGYDPMSLARQYIIRVYQDRYLDDDHNQQYINTGLKPYMRNWGREPIQLSLF